MPADATAAPSNMTHVDVPATFSFGDRYAIALALALLPVLFIVLFLTLLLWMPPLFFLLAWVHTLEAPINIIQRTCGFHVLSFIVFLLALPLIVVALTWVMTIVLFCLTMSLPVAICNMSRTCKSLAALSPYAGLPGAMAKAGAPARSPADTLAQRFGAIWPWGDIVVGLLGALHRQGIDETSYSLPAMLTLIPLMKVTLLNPFLHALEEVYINQWSDPLDANADAAVTAADVPSVKKAISHQVCSAILKDATVQILDGWPFAGFHPFPPAGRASNTVAGVQMGLGGKVLMLSHTYHGQDFVPEHTPRSEFGAWTCIVVLAQVWNPWYNLTGYVELNLRTDGGMEHPMWLLADPRSKLAMTFMASVNRTFVKLGTLFAEYLKTRPAWKQGEGRGRAKRSAKVADAEAA